jgi:hypothetical protein
MQAQQVHLTDVSAQTCHAEVGMWHFTTVRSRQRAHLNNLELVCFCVLLAADRFDAYQVDLKNNLLQADSLKGTDVSLNTCHAKFMATCHRLIWF